ncbi:motile sperm domain-containing protein 2-like isoform X1 [Bolinopsis microptera]|uniref:motile sperm domain-containing protein 2-like isoform X1 n=1 Tax=Bolinopsis microptera TaxID=2820187 RepID=UPI003079E467
MEDQVDEESLIVQLRTAFLQQNLEPFDSRDVSKIRNDDRAVLAYLKNCRFNLEKAFNMMTESLKWRKSFGVNDINKESFSPDLLTDPYLYFKGYGKHGEPLLIWDIRRHKKNNTTVNAEMKKLMPLLLDRREGAKDYKKVIMLFNMSGCGLSNIDYDFIKYLISLLTEYYPDILDNLLVFEMPRLLSAAWTIIKNMLDEDSRDAIKFVNKSDVLEYVEKDQLPISLGGTNEVAATNVMENEFQSLVDKKQVTFTQQTSPRRTQSTTSSDSKTSPDKNMSPLQVTPHDTLTFSVQQSNAESLPQAIKMVNNREVQVAYKVKTTAPEHYRVKPTVGIIEPGQECEVSVQLTPGSAVTASRDRFLVQCTEITSPFKGDITEYWRSVEQGKVTEHRLRCKVVMNGVPSKRKLII